MKIAETRIRTILQTARIIKTENGRIRNITWETSQTEFPSFIFGKSQQMLPGLIVEGVQFTSKKEIFPHDFPAHQRFHRGRQTLI